MSVWPISCAADDPIPDTSFPLQSAMNDAPLAALPTFTPFDLSTAGRVIIAAFFADVDTRVGNTATYGSGAVDGHSAWFASMWTMSISGRNREASHDDMRHIRSCRTTPAQSPSLLA